MNLRAIPVIAALVATTACGGDPSTLDGTPDESGLPPNVKTDLVCSDQPSSRSYKGFDGQDLTLSRVDEGFGINRFRLRPFPLLLGEFERVLGKLPNGFGARFASASDSFDLPPPFAYSAPQASAVGLTAYFELAFAASSAHIASNAARYASLPTAESARSVCADFSELAWRRRPSENELTTCVALATTKLTEPTPTKRWAYVLSSILSTADFLAY